MIVAIRKSVANNLLLLPPLSVMRHVFTHGGGAGSKHSFRAMLESLDSEEPLSGLQSEPLIKRKLKLAKEATVTTGEFGIELGLFLAKMHHVMDDAAVSRVNPRPRSPGSGPTQTDRSFLGRIRNGKKAARLLKTSRRFMDIVNALDKHYVAFGGLSRVEGWRHRWQPDPDGVLTKGPFSGRRVVWIRADSHGSYFRRAGFGQDTDQIRIQDDAAANVDGARKPDSPEDFVQRVAHETVHVFHRVREKPPKTGAPLADIVDRQVREEIQTREEERTILDEIGREVKKTDPVASKSLLKAAKNIETARGVVERDFVVIDGKQTTYLERFVLDHLIASSFPADESVRRRRRTFVDEVVLPETEEELAKIVAKRSFNGLRHSNGTKVVGSFLSDFEKHLLAERLIHQRWSSMKGPSNPARMEERLTEHAAFLFPRQRGQRRVSYSPLP